MERILGDFGDCHRTVRGGDLAEQRLTELVIEPTGAGPPITSASSRASDPSSSSAVREPQNTRDGFRAPPILPRPRRRVKGLIPFFAPSHQKMLARMRLIVYFRTHACDFSIHINGSSVQRALVARKLLRPLR